MSTDSPENYLSSINAARSNVGVAPLSWDNDLAEYAQLYAEQRSGDGTLIKSGGPYGECLFRGVGQHYSAADVVASFLSGKEYYDYPTNSCQPDQDCRNYTQLVWRDTTRMGAGKVICDDGTTFVVLSFDPPGNFDGEWPY